MGAPLSSFPGGVLSAGVPIFGNDPLGFTPGKVIWVDPTNGSDSFSGTRDNPVQTLAGANTLATAGNGDIIVVLPGTYTLTATLSPKKYTRWVPAILRGSYPTVLVTGNIASLVDVEVDGVQFDGFGFTSGGNTNTSLILVANTANVLSFSLTRCYLDAGSTTTSYAINATAAATSMRYATIGWNLFTDTFNTAAIGIGANGMRGTDIIVNRIGVKATCTGINLADTTAITVGKWARIAWNTFQQALGAASTDKAITIAGTQHTTAEVAIHDNRSVYLAAAGTTQAKINYAIIENFGGDVATGGTLWAP